MRLLRAWFASAILALPTIAHADPQWGPSYGGTMGVPATRTVSTTSPLGGGGALSGDLTLTCTLCVTSTSTFTADNAILRADGVGRGAQSSGVRITDTSEATFPAGGSLVLHNLADETTNTEFMRLRWDANVARFDIAETGTGSNRTFLLTGAAGGTYEMNAGQRHIFYAGGAAGNAVVEAFGTLNANGYAQGGFLATNTVNQSGAASYDAFGADLTITACGSAGCNLFRGKTGGVERFRIDTSGAADVDSTITPAGTTGNQTINKPCGTANIAASGTSVAITNNLVTANTILDVDARTNDSTCRVANYVPAAGSVTINMTAACTAETSVGFCIDDRN